MALTIAGEVSQELAQAHEHLTEIPTRPASLMYMQTKGCILKSSGLICNQEVAYEPVNRSH